MKKTVQIELVKGRILSIETGKLAKEAGGSVVVRLGDTMILATATASSKPREGIDFFPLLVDFEEKLYAVGKIPGGFFKREGRPTEKAILTARKVDRPIRPLFPKGFRNDVQVTLTPLSVDQDNPPDILAINAASAALSISDVPFEGPIGAVRVAKIDNKLVVNPTMEEMKDSKMDLVVAGTKDAIMMIEAGAEQVSEEDVIAAIKDAHKVIKEIIKIQEKLVKEVGKKKKEFKTYAPDEKIEEYVKKEIGSKVKEALGLSDKQAQMDRFSEIGEELKEKAPDELKALIEKKPKDIKTVIEEIEKEIVRSMILKEGKRLDGRGLDDIRELNCEVSALPRAHGSALFSRGQTQVLTVATLGSTGEAQRIEGLSPEETTKRYMHHYNFPAYSVGEVRPLRGPGRREIGHGALAERALLTVLPSEEEFPYAIRLVSEVLGSNGSTSMASTCGSTLALMDAGIKIDSPVAGISVGLVTEGKKYVTLMDIQGIEDHLGDMDFKVAGTRSGITAIQVDCKIKGLSYEIIERAFEIAKKGRDIILDKIQSVIEAPREELSPYAPRVITIKINPEKIGLLIGPGGKNIRKITEETGVQIDIDDDGTVLVTTADSKAAEDARKRIEDMTFEPKAGDVFKSKVVRIMNFGAFCELPGGKDGLVHISQLDDRRVAKVEDVLKIGDEVVVKVLEIDDMGRINLTKKGVTEEDKKRIR